MRLSIVSSLFICFAGAALALHSEQRPLIEAKAGYFFFTSTMGKVYDEGGVDIQLSGSYPVYSVLHVYGSVEYLQKSGHSLNGDQKTSLWAAPISLGLRPVIPITQKVDYYFTLGPRYFFVYTHNRSSYVPEHMNSNGIGGFANTGFLFNLGSHFTLDLFGEYSYTKLKFHPHKHETQTGDTVLSGFTFGGGLGYSF